MGSVLVFLFTLAAMCMTSSQAKINVTDYIYWKKQDIYQWDRFFPSRTLEEELRTIDAAMQAVTSLVSGFEDSHRKVLAFPYRELETAKEFMAGTDAEGCVNGVSKYLDQVIHDQLDAYEDCTGGAQANVGQLYRHKRNLDRVKTSYQTVLQRTLAAINSCAKTYPNEDSIDRLKSCVDSMSHNYFQTAKTVKSLVSPSPSMGYFHNTVVGCAASAVDSVVAKGFQFLKMLVSCAALSGTLDPSTYAEELSKWKGYNYTLADQILDSQLENNYQVLNVEKVFQNFYSLQKQALELYVIESRGLDFYLKKVYSYLSDYYNTLTSTSLDNPGDSGCVEAAKSALDFVAMEAAVRSLSCDQVTVNDTKRLFAEVYDNCLYVNDRLPSIGNVAVLNCISQGYVFAPNTIKDCFMLSSSGFDVEYDDRRDSSVTDIAVLGKYVDSFFANSDLPCGDATTKRLYLGADKALYDLQRCLYKSSGTSYRVTTPTSLLSTTQATPET